MSRLSVLPGLDAATYQNHALHADDSVWVEKNCYVDIWIETLHALRLNPVAVMPFTLAIDFEGDQWTFFKPSHDELHELYGVTVQELTVWKPLLEHTLEHLGAGKFISTESDAFWLPDTSGTDYRTQHTKTTIVINEIDVENQRVGYFHNAGYHFLDGEDFARLFRIGLPEDPTYLPFFAELIHIGGLTRRPEAELAALSLDLLRKHFNRAPATNPIEKFKARVVQDLPVLHARGLNHYHAWAFATTRQIGSAFELTAANLCWLASHGHVNLQQAANAFTEISAANKTFILKGARAVNSKRALDFDAIFDPMCAAWNTGMQSLSNTLK